MAHHNRDVKEEGPDGDEPPRDIVKWCEVVLPLLIAGVARQDSASIMIMILALLVLMYWMLTA